VLRRSRWSAGAGATFVMDGFQEDFRWECAGDSIGCALHSDMADILQTQRTSQARKLFNSMNRQLAWYQKDSDRHPSQALSSDCCQYIVALLYWGSESFSQKEDKLFALPHYFFSIGAF
jgi:hypothetical protein